MESGAFGLAPVPSFTVIHCRPPGSPSSLPSVASPGKRCCTSSLITLPSIAFTVTTCALPFANTVTRQIGGSPIRSLVIMPTRPATFACAAFTASAPLNLATFTSPLVASTIARFIEPPSSSSTS